MGVLEGAVVEGLAGLEEEEGADLVRAAQAARRPRDRDGACSARAGSRRA